ncbi:MAG: hypothetical protein JRH18_09100 [Deltaproteobacteria bacterium]|nr:hypothetical protein [Deltaproteobacteria bacterium]MBW1962990.1 hypothetical protein [Deltaproteobacteria bacterium]MBW1993187.1 hypothetical protein [Deltaproteobacteria bacterium]MBW2151811.1 hypothetical protein [Deltaproteobacteria bacterium]
MRSFELLAFRHVILFIIPTLVFILLLWAGLKNIHFQSKDSEERKQKILHVFPGDIEERDSPSPLVLFLIIGGFVLWAIFYTLGYGLFGEKI